MSCDSSEVKASTSLIGDSSSSAGIGRSSSTGKCSSSSSGYSSSGISGTSSSSSSVSSWCAFFLFVSAAYPCTKLPS